MCPLLDVEVEGPEAAEGLQAALARLQRLPLAAEARRLGIDIGRSQVRRILLAEGVRWRRTRSWTRSKDRDFVRITGLYTCPPDGRLCRRARAGDPPILSAGTGLVAGRTPHQERDRLWPRAGETWVYGALRVADGHELTMTASSRNSAFYQQFLQRLEEANPVGQIVVVTDNLSSLNSLFTRTWLEDHPRIRHVFIPVGVCCSTCRRAGGASSARPLWPGNPSLDLPRLTRPPAWRPPTQRPSTALWQTSTPTRRFRRRYVYIF
ncbi:hypothetical protein [Streptomyces sp. NPDC002889]|uniref:hypothetical protein n=1 Tax=Streptomyces sp. NPDC002889 TaxID=3364669 RepID=UPI0036A28965